MPPLHQLFNTVWSALGTSCIAQYVLATFMRMFQIYLRSQYYVLCAKKWKCVLLKRTYFMHKSQHDHCYAV